MRRYLIRKSQKIWNRTVKPVLHERSVKWARQGFRSSTASQRLLDGENTFVLYRILGNDLPPRHRPGQTLTNLNFIIENEQDFDNCEKWWVVNRIFDDDQRQSIIECLEAHGQRYFIIDFSASEYSAICDDHSVRRHLSELQTPIELDSDQMRRLRLAELRPKILYIINNNGARNRALEHGRNRAKWVLPWDGNCMMTQDGWARIRHGIERLSDIPYHIVPMCRLPDNRLILDPEFRPECDEEPQIIFHTLSSEIFNEAIPYGRRPKVDLLMRLGLWGNWQSWTSDPWDVPFGQRCNDFGAFVLSDGWVGRLHSGNAEQEIGYKSARVRMLNRDEAIVRAIENLDSMLKLR